MANFIKGQNSGQVFILSLSLFFFFQGSAFSRSLVTDAFFYCRLSFGPFPCRRHSFTPLPE
jgi:hypothetical protein